MTQEIDKLTLKSQRALNAAWTLFNEGDYDFAAARAYYAMFYITEALLLTKGLAASKHKGLINLLFENFVRPGQLDKKYHQILHHGFELRQQGDYWADSEISNENAHDMLKETESFLEHFKKLIKQQS